MSRDLTRSVPSEYMRGLEAGVKSLISTREYTEFVAQKNSRQLRQNTSIQDYVKQFSALMLDMPDMSMDKLFNFLYGLKPWA